MHLHHLARPLTRLVNVAFFAILNLINGVLPMYWVDGRCSGHVVNRVHIAYLPGLVQINYPSSGESFCHMNNTALTQRELYLSFMSSLIDFPPNSFFPSSTTACLFSITIIHSPMQGFFPRNAAYYPNNRVIIGDEARIWCCNGSKFPGLSNTTALGGHNDGYWQGDESCGYNANEMECTDYDVA